MIIAIGDSITKGDAGFSYLEFLPYDAVNEGVNGDTTICARHRMKKCLKKYPEADTYIVAIGVNDILFKRLRLCSLFWRTIMSIKCVLKRAILDDALFKKEYEKYLIILKENNKKAILAGIPIIQLADFPAENDVTSRNAIIKELAEKYNCAFIDTPQMQKTILGDNTTTYAWGKTNFSRIIDDAKMIIDPDVKDRFADDRNLIITVDGVHFSRASAKALAAAVECEIKK